MKKQIAKVIATFIVIALCIQLFQSKVNNYIAKENGVWSRSIAYMHLYMVDIGERNNILPSGSLKSAIEYEGLMLKGQPDEN